MSTHRHLAATLTGAVVAVGLVIGVAVGLQGTGDESLRPSAAGSPSDPSAGRGATKAPAAPAGSAGDKGTKATKSRPDARPQVAPPSGSAPKPTGRAGIEQLDDPHPTTYRLPSAGKRQNPSVLVTDTPDDEAHATGRLAAGYPEDVLPAVPGSRVRSSSVSPAGDRVQVALVADRPANIDESAVLAFYRRALARHGFAETDVPTVGATSAAAFTHGASSAVVTATGHGTYTLFATLATG